MMTMTMMGEETLVGDLTPASLVKLFKFFPYLFYTVEPSAAMTSRIFTHLPVLYSLSEDSL